MLKRIPCFRASLLFSLMFCVYCEPFQGGQVQDAAVPVFDSGALVDGPTLVDASSVDAEAGGLACSRAFLMGSPMGGLWGFANATASDVKGDAWVPTLRQVLPSDSAFAVARHPVPEGTFRLRFLFEVQDPSPTQNGLIVSQLYSRSQGKNVFLAWDAAARAWRWRDEAGALLPLSGASSRKGTVDLYVRITKGSLTVALDSTLRNSIIANFGAPEGGVPAADVDLQIGPFLNGQLPDADITVAYSDFRVDECL